MTVPGQSGLLLSDPSTMYHEPFNSLSGALGGQAFPNYQSQSQDIAQGAANKLPQLTQRSNGNRFQLKQVFQNENDKLELLKNSAERQRNTLHAQSTTYGDTKEAESKREHPITTPEK